MTRLEAFIGYKTDPMRAKMVKRLSGDEYVECIGFIERYDKLNKFDFEFLLNRWKLDQPKTKHHTDMYSLICEANSAAAESGTR